MNSFTQLVQQIKSADYASANQTFAEIMQQKVADRLAVERQSIFTETVDLDPKIWKWDNHSWIHVMYLDHEMSAKQRTEVLQKLRSQSPTAYYKISTTKPTNPPTAAAAAKDREDRTWRLSNLIQAIKDNW